MREENNTDTLKEKLEIALKALQFYANRRNFDFGSEKELRFCNSDDQADVFQPFGTKAKEALRRIECLSQI